MVPAVSTRASPTPAYSGYPTFINSYQYGTLTLFGPPSQMVPVPFDKFIRVLQPPHRLNDLGLGYSPFARHYLGNHFCFLFLQVLRCFSSLGSPPLCGYGTFSTMGCPIRISTDHRMCASPRSFSQLTTSFFASESLGILHTPFFTFLSMLLLSLSY
jgi:hypothetical protein